MSDWTRMEQGTPAERVEVLLSRDDGTNVVATYEYGHGGAWGRWRWPLGMGRECVAGVLQGDLWMYIPSRPIEAREDDDGDEDGGNCEDGDMLFPEDF